MIPPGDFSAISAEDRASNVASAATAIRERLRTLLAEQAYERREVTLASGRTSHFYVDCRRVTLSSEGHFLVGWLLNHLIQRSCPEVVAVGGMSIGADAIVSSVSTMSYMAGRSLGGIYVRKAPKAHGTAKWIECGYGLPSSARVAVVEDTITSGGSVLNAVDRLAEAGFEPVHAFALVDREEGGRAAVESRLPLTTLFAPHDLGG